MCECVRVSMYAYLCVYVCVYVQCVCVYDMSVVDMGGNRYDACVPASGDAYVCVCVCVCVCGCGCGCEFVFVRV